LFFGVEGDVDLEVESDKDGVGFCVFFETSILVESVVPVVYFLVQMFFNELSILVLAVVSGNQLL
jgi:hypothetical protein